MCQKIPARSEKDVREKPLSSEKVTRFAQRKDHESAAAPVAMSRSGVMAAFRRLFASSEKEPAESHRQHDEVKQKTMEDKPELEKTN